MTQTESRPSAGLDFSAGKEFAARASAVIPGGVNSGTRAIGAPWSLTRGEGAYVTDLDGNRLLDFHSAFGAILLGHNAPEVESAVHGNRDAITLAGTGVTSLEVELAERLCRAIPSVDKTILVNTGSEAVAMALRVARAETGRRHIIKFQGGFHGWSDPVVRNVISTAENAYQMDPITAGVLPEVLEATLVAEFNDIESVKAQFDAHPGDIAAVIMEPIPHNVGALIPTQEFLEGLRQLTRDQGTVLIFDEVITGFRHALGGYQEITGVTPDLTTFGKALGNGYPVAGMGGRADLMDHCDVTNGGDVALLGTFNGNATSCLAGIAVIDHLRANPDFYQRTHRLGAKVRDGFNELFRSAGVGAQAAGFGGCFTLYFLEGQISGYRDLLRNNNRASQEFFSRWISKGFLALPIPMKRNHISGVTTDADVDAALAAAEPILADLKAEGIV